MILWNSLSMRITMEIEVIDIIFMAGVFIFGMYIICDT